MFEDYRVVEEISAMFHRGVEEGLDAADVALLHSKLREATEADISSLLADFFDIELVVELINEQFVSRGEEWPSDLRLKLVEALTFCGMDLAAQQVLESRR